MTNPVHLLTVAALLLASFLIGAVVGTLLRLVSMRSVRPVLAAAAPPEEAPAPAAAPLVATPVIAPLPVAPTPTAPAPADVPVPDFAATMIALANEAPPPAFIDEPARVAGETTSGIHVAAPRHENPPDAPTKPALSTGEHTAEVIAFPAPASETSAAVVPEPEAPIVVGSPAPLPAAAAAASGPVTVPSDDAAQPSAVVEAVPPPDRAALAVPEEVTPGPVSAGVPLAAAAPSLPVETAAEEPVEPSPAAPAADLPEQVVEAVRAEAQPVAAAAADLVDEDAAMRAIEGSGPPRRPVQRALRPATAPEAANQAVAASARAVIAARRTAEAIVAEVAVEAGRPAGLDAPRDGRKDELTHIIGVLPVIETALNQLGIYHFDQIGQLTDDNVGWIEGHLGVPGRISRELWREQARELSAVLRPKHAAES